MEKIKSFTVDHFTLMPGVHVSREDQFGPPEVFGTEAAAVGPAAETVYPITTFDIRITRPNFEPVMNTGEIHTIEHLGATYLRNSEAWKKRTVYWGPMGCRTGFYLILAGRPSVAEVIDLMDEVFDFVESFEGEIPGAKPEECGNYSDMDLPGAKIRAAAYRKVLSGQKTAEESV